MTVLPSPVHKDTMSLLYFTYSYRKQVLMISWSCEQSRSGPLPVLQLDVPVSNLLLELPFLNL